MSNEEYKFIARAFAALPPEVLIKENIKIYDKPTVKFHED